MEKTDVHNYKRRVELIRSKLKEDKRISDNNKIKIIEFANFCRLNNISSGRVHKYFYTLRNIALWGKKDFDEMNRKDIENIILTIDDCDYKPQTKDDYRAVIKRFWKWLKGLDEENIYPDEVRWIKRKRVNGSKLPDELLSEDEISKIVNCADNSRDKAFIKSLYESGCRIGELASLKIKHISFDKNGAVLIVSGKTGDRRIRIISSVPLLANWINVHPHKDDPESPVWFGFGKRNKKTAVSYNALSIALKQAAKRAEIKKRIHPHLLRHSRATFMARFMTEAQMKQYFGWTQGSGMAATYVHLSGRDVDDVILKVNGVETKNNKSEESSLKPINCSRCEFLSDSGAKFCQKCGSVLDIKTALDIDDANRNMMAMMHNANVPDAKFILEAIKKENISKDEINKAIEILKPLIKSGIIK